MSFVVLGLGSNTSWNGMNCMALLRGAVSSLSSVLANVVWSSVYRTKPMYETDQSDFYNMVVTGTAGESIAPGLLLEAIHKIESSFGRDRSKEKRNGPRPLDIDIELFGNSVIHTDDLEIPHPRIKERAFVLIPLLEILPDSADSIKRENYAADLRLLPEQGVVLDTPKEKFMEFR